MSKRSRRARGIPSFRRWPPCQGRAEQIDRQNDKSTDGTEPIEPTPFTMPFGEWKGRVMDDIPASYLRFFLTLKGLRPYVIEAITVYLGERGPGGGGESSRMAEPRPGRKSGRVRSRDDRDQAYLPLVPWEGEDGNTPPPPAATPPGVDVPIESYDWL